MSRARSDSAFCASSSGISRVSCIKMRIPRLTKRVKPVAGSGSSRPTEMNDLPRNQVLAFRLQRLKVSFDFRGHKHPASVEEGVVVGGHPVENCLRDARHREICLKLGKVYD